MLICVVSDGMITPSQETRGRIMTEEKAMVDTETVARYLDVHPRTVINYVESGLLRAYKVGKNWRYHWQDVYDYLASVQHKPGDTPEGK